MAPDKSMEVKVIDTGMIVALLLPKEFPINANIALARMAVMQASREPY